MGSNPIPSAKRSKFEPWTRLTPVAASKESSPCGRSMLPAVTPISETTKSSASSWGNGSARSTPTTSPFIM